MRKLGLTFIALAITAGAGAHDIWIEPSVNLVRTGDWVRLSLMLGNHGNTHRDFRLASKISAGDQNLFVVAPNGKRFDLTSSLIDNGYTPQEGFWSTKFAPDQRGLYLVGSTMDKVMSYAPVRDIKSAKTFFVVADKLDKVAEKNPGFDRVLGHPLEIVPMENPVTPMGAGSEFKVKVLYKGKPLAGTKVSFIPKGAELKGETDPEHEKLTDAKGTVTVTLKEANLYLIVAHQKDATAKGEGYQSIGYSARLCLVVPTFCPCCR